MIKGAIILVASVLAAAAYAGTVDPIARNLAAGAGQKASDNVWYGTQNFTKVIDLSTTSFPSLLDLAGTSQSYSGSPWPGRMWEWSVGTTLAPLTTTVGPAVKGSCTESYVAGSGGGNPVDNTSNACLSVWSVGDANDNMQVNAINANALTSSTQAPNYDAVGINAQGRITGAGALGKGTGVYSAGRRDVDTARASGGQFQMYNNTSTNCGVSITGLGNCSVLEAVGYAPPGVGAGVGVHIHSQQNAPWGGLLNEGVLINQLSVSDVGFDDQSSDTTSYKVGGSHTDILDASGATCTGKLLKGPNNGLTADCSGNLSALTFQLTGDFSVPTLSTNGTRFVFSANTITDTTDSGTVGNAYVNKMGGATIAATNPTTFTTIVSLEIAAPIAGANATITNARALRLDGSLDMQTNNVVNGATVAAASTSGYDLINGNSTSTNATVIPNRASTNTGFGGASGAVDVIAAGTDVFRIGTGSHAYGVGFGTAAITETGYLCYNSGSTPANELLLDTTACLSSLEEYKNVKSIMLPKDALSDVMKLRPFWYTWNQKTHPSSDKHIQPGLGAHAVEKTDPRLAAYDAKGKLKGVRYEQMVAVLVAAVQQQEREIASLRAELRHSHVSPLQYGR